MSLFTALALSDAVNGLSACTQLSLHSAYSAVGANEITTVRGAVTFTVATSNIASATAPVSTTATVGATAAWIGMWDAANRFMGMVPLGSTVVQFFCIDSIDLNQVRCPLHNLTLGTTVVVWALASGGTRLPGGFTEGTIYSVLVATPPNPDDLWLSLDGINVYPATYSGTGYLQVIAPQTIDPSGTYVIPQFNLFAA